MFGLIRRAKNQMRKAEAAAALENLLVIQSEVGNLDGDPHIIANDMISDTWNRSSQQINWQNQDPPHKVSLVALSLAERVERTKYGDPSYFAYGIALGTVLSTAARNRGNLGFSPLDDFLLETAGDVLQKSCDAMEKLPLMNDIKGFLDLADK